MTTDSDEFKNKVVELHNSGLSLRKIGSQLNLSKDKVAQILKTATNETADSLSVEDNKDTKGEGSLPPGVSDEKVHIFGGAGKVPFTGEVASQVNDLRALRMEVEHMKLEDDRDNLERQKKVRIKNSELEAKEKSLDILERERVLSGSQNSEGSSAISELNSLKTRNDQLKQELHEKELGWLQEKYSLGLAAIGSRLQQLENNLGENRSGKNEFDLLSQALTSLVTEMHETQKNLIAYFLTGPKINQLYPPGRRSVEECARIGAKIEEQLQAAAMQPGQTLIQASAPTSASTVNPKLEWQKRFSWLMSGPANLLPHEATDVLRPETDFSMKRTLLLSKGLTDSQISAVCSPLTMNMDQQMSVPQQQQTGTLNIVQKGDL